MSKSDMEVAHQTQEKFEFYLISLVFTLLALSVQTAKFGDNIIPVIFELSGWLFLLTSGLFGLWRIEYLSIERVKLVKLDELHDQINEVKRLMLSGQEGAYVLSTSENQPLEERIKNLEEGVVLLTPLTKKLETKNTIKYNVHKFTFVFGVIFLVASRGAEPFVKIIHEAFKCT